MKDIQGVDAGTRSGRPRCRLDFDFPQLARSPIYQALIGAVSDAGNATQGVLTDEEWDLLLDVAGEAARYGDQCNGCGRGLVFPFRSKYADHGVVMTYLCDCGNTWITSYGNDW